ncbi:MAG: phospho-sugar mutase [Actinomycetes bacterium]
MIDDQLRAEVEEWIALDPDPITAAQLRLWLAEENEVQLKQSFSGFLQFGTAGLRGPMGPGPSCMNRAVVSRAAAGLAVYMKNHGLSSVVIGRDARYGSEDFTFESAEIFSGAGLEVFILPRPLPTPVLAFAVNELKVGAGVMVTASHNPPQDNGYKVYLGGTVAGQRYYGSQIVPPADIEIAAEIAKIHSSSPRGAEWTILNDDIFNEYISRTIKLATKSYQNKIVYSAMHGVGTETVQAVFAAAGYAAPILVAAQAQPDPDFPTVQFPNPEEPGAIDLSLQTAKENDADLVIANDPDADRCAAAALDPKVGWRMLRGDEVGALLGYFIASEMPELVVGKSFGNSIVSSSILSKIASHHRIEFHETLTGFKWLAKIENLGFGYEEALGYAVDALTVNDKDGVSAALMLAQVLGVLKERNTGVIEYLDQIWNTYGFHRTEQISIRVASLDQVDQVLAKIRSDRPEAIAGYKVIKFEDLLVPENELPPTNGLRIWLEQGVRIIIRPSGTEAKLKCYIEVVRPGGTDQDKESAETIVTTLKTELLAILT